MNWSMLWFLLAGAILGFAISTLWEWLYFRSQRAVLRDERIDELEAALQASRTREAQPVSVANYTDGAARLETEEPENLAPIVEEGSEADQFALAESIEAEIEEASTGEVLDKVSEEASQEASKEDTDTAFVELPVDEMFESDSDIPTAEDVVSPETDEPGTDEDNVA